jgi:hypothetical protein
VGAIGVLTGSLWLILTVAANGTGSLGQDDAIRSNEPLREWRPTMVSLNR